MAFTVADFPDLLRLLGEHPEWRAELRRHVLTDELLELPALVRQLAEAQARTEESLARLIARVDALAEAQNATEKQLTWLAKQVEELVGGQARLVIEMGQVKGEVLELRYRARAPAYFSRLARRLRVLDPGVLADQLDDAVQAGQLEDAERDAILEADIVLTGKRRQDEADVYVVVQVSTTIDPHDVDRAAERAVLLGRLGRPAVAAVAGGAITASAATLARQRGVWQVLNGHVGRP